MNRATIKPCQLVQSSSGAKLFTGTTVVVKSNDTILPATLPALGEGTAVVRPYVRVQHGQESLRVQQYLRKAGMLPNSSTTSRHVAVFPPNENILRYFAAVLGMYLCSVKRISSRAKYASSTINST